MFQKKYICIVIFIFIFLPSFTRAKTTTDHFEAMFIKNYSYVDTFGKHANFEHYTRVSDKSTSYCIEPGVPLSSHTYYGYYDLTLEEMGEKVDLSKRRLEKIALYAYFGYGYKGRHKGDDWIVATQTLIWNEVGRNLEFTSGYHPENPSKYIIDVPEEIQRHMEEIQEYVESYLEQPNFSTNHAIIPLNGVYNYGKLNGYEVKECDNCTFFIQNNELVVMPITNGYGRISLEKRVDSYDKKFIVYASNDGQNIMVAGNLEPKTLEVDFEVSSGKLKLIKYDADSKNCSPKENGALKGSVYKLYKENGTFVKNLVIGNDCSATAENLELGNYYVQEERPGLNYELDLNTYSFSITNNSLIKELVVYDKMYLGQVEIKKYDKDTKSCNSVSSSASLKGAVYGIYTKEGTLLNTLEIDKNCKAISKRDLLLGEYYLQEIQAPLGYKLDPKKYNFSVTKENADSTVVITLYDEVFKTKVVINKNYLYFNDLLPEKEASFEIYNKKDLRKIATILVNEKGFAEIELPYGEYILKQVKGKEGYHFIENISFVVDETVESKTNMKLLNQPFKGALEFYKTDLLTGKFLSNVFVEVYNEKEQLIFSGLTDKNGHISIKDIPYGKYYIVEKKALDNYYLNKEKLYFEIVKDKQIVTTTMVNEQMVKVPKTKKNDLNLNVLLAVLFVILGIEIILYAKEKK